MKLVKTEDAVGQILCHDITRIVINDVKDTPFRKGHIITQDDIPLLLSLGKEHLYIWENDDSIMHENDAAEVLREICQNEYMHPTPVKEGKIELISDVDGLFLVDIERLREINMFGEMIIATISSGLRVKKGDRLCGMRIIPLVIKKEKMLEAKKLIGKEPILKLIPYKKKTFGVVTTGSEVFKGRIKDTFTPVLEDKLGEYGAEMKIHEISDDSPENILSSINKIADTGVDIILCTGGMSVDPDDKTPLAIRNSGANIVSYGSPVLPGSMFLIGYLSDNRPICGLPGCVMYNKRTIFDIVLMRLMADVPITREYLAGLGNGGFCMSCPVCYFPNCGFGKGV